MLTIRIVTPDEVRKIISSPKTYELTDDDIADINLYIISAFKRVWITNPEAKKARVSYYYPDKIPEHSIVDVMNWNQEKRNQLKDEVDTYLRNAGFEFKFHNGKGGYIHVIEK